jgi:hypothetical protein
LVRVPATLLADLDAWVDGQSCSRLTPPAIRRMIEEPLAQGDISELKRPHVALIQRVDALLAGRS